MILGYSLPRKSLQKMKFVRFRIYIQAVNLFTITNYSGLDPEAGGSPTFFGFDFGNYPNNQKQFLAGLSITF